MPKPRTTQQATSTTHPISERSHSEQQRVKTHAEKREADLRPVSFGVEQDFGQIPIHSHAARVIQTKRTITEPEDVYEQEANRIAEKVTRATKPQSHPCACGGTCPKCQAERLGVEPDSLTAKRVNAGDLQRTTLPHTVHEILRSTGQPLDPATRDSMETRFGHDFSHVRVHLGAAAERSARDVNARAYTVSQNIVFGANEFAPGTPDGLGLIAHELAHTVQQSQGAPLAVAREPKGPRFAVNQQNIDDLRSTMLRFYELLSPAARASLNRNTTVVIALVTYENEPTFAYTVASNSINPSIRAAADRLGLLRFDPEGIDKVAGERHAEQLTIEATSRYGFKTQAMAVTRKPCLDCGPVVAEEGIPIEWVRDPHPAPETPGTSGIPPVGGVLPSAPPGQLPDPINTVPQAAEPTEVAAHVGAPIEPVVEATPGFQPEGGAGFGGAFQILQSMQFGNLQRSEIDKFQARYAALQPKIDAYLEKGRSVELVLIVEKPDRPDFFCAAGVFCDQSQFVYFRDLYINYVANAEPVAITVPSTSAPTTSAPSMGPAGGRGGYVPYTHEGGSIIDEKEIPSLRARYADYHCEFAKQTLYPQQNAFRVPPLAPRYVPRPEKVKSPLDQTARKALAAAPARVYVESENVVQYKTASAVIKALAGNSLFGEVKENMGGGLGGKRTIISYRNDLDKPKAEALVAIVRANGVPTASAELSGNGDDDPGVLTIWFSRDAEK